MFFTKYQEFFYILWILKSRKFVFIVQYLKRWFCAGILTHQQLYNYFSCLEYFVVLSAHFQFKLKMVKQRTFSAEHINCLEMNRNYHSLRYSLLSNGMLRNKMKLFQSLQTFYHSLGIHPSQSEKRPSFNFHNLFIPANFLVFFIFQIAFFLLKAETIVERSETFYSSLTIFGCNVIFIINFWKMPHIVQLIGNFEKFIEKSEYCERFSRRVIQIS